MAGPKASFDVEAHDKTARGLKSAKGNVDELGKSTKRVGDIAAGILASQVFERIGEAAVRAFTSTIKAASDLQESVNAVQVVFGNAADGVMAIGENSAQSMGLSQRAFNEAAVRFSAFAETIAGEGGNVAGVVEEVTQRSSDFASVMNIDVAQAMQLFQSGLAGESEPLRRYGIDVSAAAVQTEAYASGIAEAGSELSENQKIQARYNLIMKQTSDTQGDFANTSDDAANAQRIFSAELEDMQSSMGQAMLPTLGTLLSFLTDVLRGFQALPGPVQTITLALGGLAAATGAAVAALRVLGVTAASVQAALGPIAIAVAVGGALVGGLAALGSQSEDTAGKVDQLSNALEKGTGAVTDAAREFAVMELREAEVLETTRDLGIGMEDAATAWLGQEDALNRVIPLLDEVIKANTEFVNVPRRNEPEARMNDQATAAQDLKNELLDGNEVTADAVQLTGDMANATGQASSAATAAAGPLSAIASNFGHVGDEAEDAAQKMLDAWSASFQDFVSGSDAFQSVADANREAAESSGSGSAGAAEDSAKRIEEAQERVTDAKEAQTDAHEEAAEQIEDAEEALADAVEQRSEQIADAKQKVSDATESGVDRVTAAEERLADAQDESRQAQEDLTAARQEAADQLAEFSGRIEDAALSEESAELRLARAHEREAETRQAGSEASALDRREADLAVRQAERNLEKSQQRLQELRDEQQAAQRAGVEGSEVVQQALEGQRDAAESVADAQQGLVEAQQEAAERVAEAQQDLADVQEDSAERVEDAQEALSDAHENAADRIEDAGEAVADALEAMEESAVSSAGGASSAMSDMAADASVTADQYIGELERMVRDQEEWADNLVKLSARVPPEMLNELAKMGPGAAEEIALLESMSEEELNKVIDLYGRSGEDAGLEFAEELAAIGPALARISQEHGTTIATEIANKIADNKDLSAKEAKLLMDGVEDEVEGRELLAAIEPFLDKKARQVVLEELDELAAPVEVPFSPDFGQYSAPQNQFYGSPTGGIGGAEHETSGSGNVFPLPEGSYSWGQGPSGHGYDAQDLPTPTGTPVRAPVDGFANVRDLGSRSYGKYVEIMGSRMGRVVLAHLSKLAVSSGHVAAGSLVGWSGSSGKSTGPHLHVEPSKVLRRRAGGNVGAATDTLINEARPEVVNLPNGSKVVPSTDQAFDRNQMAGTGGGLTINLYVQGSIRSDRDLVELIRDEMLNGGFRGALEGAGA